jgi:ankyrin repeat protein
MIMRTYIDRLFKLCPEGVLQPGDLSAISHVTSLRDINNQSLLDIAVQYSQVDTVRFLLNFDFISASNEYRKVLILAVKAGNPEIFKMLHDKTDIHSPSSKFNTLELACEHGKLDIILYLLSRTTVDPFNLDHALLTASSHGHADIVTALITAGAYAHRDPDGGFIVDLLCLRQDQESKADLSAALGVLAAADIVIPSENRTFWWKLGYSAPISFINYVLSVGLRADGLCIQQALLGVLKGGTAEAAERLLTYAEENGHCIDLGELINRASYADHVDVLAVILTKYAALIQTPSASRQQTIPNKKLLLIAVACGHISTVTRLLDEVHGDLRTIDPSVVETSLSHAGDPDVIRALLNSKANIKPSQGASVLQRACCDLKPDALKVLLETGADIGIDCMQNSPLDYALADTCTEEQVPDLIAVINLLLDAGDGKWRNILSFCISSCCDGRVIDALLQRDPGLLQRSDGVSFSPLFDAVTAKHNVRGVRALIEAGADVGVKGDNSQSVYDCLFNGPSQMYSEMRDILHMLLEAGAPLDGGLESMTPLMLAVRRKTEPDEEGEVDDRASSIYVSDILDYIINCEPAMKPVSSRIVDID